MEHIVTLSVLFVRLRRPPSLAIAAGQAAITAICMPLAFAAVPRAGMLLLMFFITLRRPPSLAIAAGQAAITAICMPLAFAAVSGTEIPLLVLLLGAG